MAYNNNVGEPLLLYLINSKGIHLFFIANHKITFKLFVQLLVYNSELN